jgi:hypothetical protein
MRDRRLNNPGERPDFLARMLEHGEGKDLSKLQLAAHASDFVYVTFLPTFLPLHVSSPHKDFEQHSRKRDNSYHIKYYNFLLVAQS